MKMYEVIMYKTFSKQEKMCEYGQIGDRFFIILQGEVSVQQPKEDTKYFNTLWDLFCYAIKIHERVRTYRDEISKEIGHLINLIGAKVLRDLEFKQVRKLIDFLRQLSYLNEEILS